MAAVVLASVARLLLAVAAMPPYAGLDEAWHVARVAFVAREGREPSITERSIPPYIGAAIRGDVGATPSFGEMRARWPSVVRRGGVLSVHPFSERDLAPYESANYEAQQPSLYYRLVAPLAGGDPLSELRRLRLFSALCGIAVVVSAALIAMQWLGPAGAAAAAIIVACPTWITLVVRASNDALACALAAFALLLTATAHRTPTLRARDVAEAVAWALAVATKLYVWPLAIAVPVFWRAQKGSRTRLFLVILACILTAALVTHDLSRRTRNALGVFGFDPVIASSHAVPIDWVSMGKITAATFVWTSGQHADALRPWAMLLFVVPLAAVARLRRSPYFFAAATCAALFLVAQAFNAAGFVRQARAAGIALPLGGKEGWYWYVLTPLFAGLFAKHVRFALLWTLLWDVVITEGALFHDFAGATSPAARSLLFTWGPWHPPFTADLTAVAVGPLTRGLTALRLVHVAAVASLVCIESLMQRNRT